MGAESEDEQEAVSFVAQSFMRSLQRMSEQERLILGTAFAIGCRSEMPENVHVEIDLLRRDVELPAAEVVSVLHGMQALGIGAKEREDSSHEDPIIEITWQDHTAYEEDSLVEEFSFDRSTEIAMSMLEVGLDHFCAQCARDRFLALDFSELAGEGAD